MKILKSQRFRDRERLSGSLINTTTGYYVPNQISAETAEVQILSNDGRSYDTWTIGTQ
jgi:hypothetical protein